MIGVGIEGVGAFKVALMGLLCLLCVVTRLAGRASNRGQVKTHCTFPTVPRTNNPVHSIKP